MKPRRTFAQLQRARKGRAHADRGYDATRRRSPRLARAARIRGGARWKGVRQVKLAQDPLCEDCLDREITTAARQVDHILGVQVRPDLAYTMSNLRSLCTRCHAKKSARERRGGRRG